MANENDVGLVLVFEIIVTDFLSTTKLQKTLYVVEDTRLYEFDDVKQNNTEDLSTE